MPSADPIRVCPNPFQQQDGINIPDHIHQLAQITPPNGSHAEVFYDSVSKLVIFKYRDIYYECSRTLSVFETLNTIIGLSENIRLSQDSWVDMGQLDYDGALLESWKSLRKRHRTFQLVID